MANWYDEETTAVHRSKAKERLAKAKEMHKNEIPVRLDAKTTIFIKPGQDPETEIKKYLERLNQSRNVF